MVFSFIPFECVVCISIVIAIVTSGLTFPFVLRFAVKHNIVDNPNARKLQREPVPVMGGVSVYLGVFAGGLFLSLYSFPHYFLFGFIAMTLMLSIGVWDDIKDSPAGMRFLIELSLVCALIYFTRIYIDDFQGIFGIYRLNKWVALVLSVVAGVGIINSVNLIDGVDGYASAYGIIACVIFSILFFFVGREAIGCFSLICAGALCPFFFHNVFGLKSKMFIGDGGTLMLGMLMTLFVFLTLSSKGGVASHMGDNCGLIAFCLSVLSIPVFDTLRVMSSRIMKGRSPFSPDKTHLHHLFIDMGFSHIGAAFAIISVMILIVLCWFISWRAGASITVQTIIVLLLDFSATFGFYSFMKRQQNGGEIDSDGYPGGTKLWKNFCKLGYLTHRENYRLWHIITDFVDKGIE